MSRPQVGIDRLTPRRVTTEPRESMNCKSCRKRKIKCNRVRPSCEACKVFQCPCIYDAVPKKRGPKTDVLEALLKRVDGLERRLQEESTAASSTGETSPSTSKRKGKETSAGPSNSAEETGCSHQSSLSVMEQKDQAQLPYSDRRGSDLLASAYDNGFGDHPMSGLRHGQQANVTNRQDGGFLSDAILDTYFTRLHEKPFYILEESSTRQRHRMGQLPGPLMMAIYAITTRYSQSSEGQEGSTRTGLEYALNARQEIDVDNPTIEGLQTLLLLSMVFFAYGLGKKTYMTISSCSAMILALDLYREPSSKLNFSHTEKETRRRIFWTCYMMDRFVTCGSRRPCLISNDSVLLRLPSWSLSTSSHNIPVEGEIFNNAGPNIQLSADPRRRGQPAIVLLIDIIRILGITNRYLATGGVKGDSHFPWHSMSNLSKIRQELDLWAAGVQDIFVSVESLFTNPESTTLFLSKLIYHLIHCLIYRPFLPLDLAELRGTGQHQSWQIEATNLCFLHSNAIAELVEFGRNSSLVEWPAFISHCVCTAGTVHVHGVYYKGLEGEVFSSSADYLAKEMQQMSWLRHCWAGVQHQRELLQTVYTCHAELVRNLANNPMRYSPVFHLEDFYDRYLGISVDSSHVRLVDEVTDGGNENSHNFHNQQFSRMRSASHQSHLPQHVELPSSQFETPHQPQSQQLQSAIYSYNFNDSTSSYSNAQQDQRQLQQHSQPQQIPRALPAFSPTLGLSPSAFLSEILPPVTAPTPTSNFHYASFPFDASHATPVRTPYPAGYTAQTPSGHSQASDSHATMSESGPPSEKDPFLSLLEQLAENEHLEDDGPSELDFLLASGIHAPNSIENISTEAGSDAMIATGGEVSKHCSVRNTLEISCPLEDYYQSEPSQGDDNSYRNHFMFANYFRQTTKSLRPSTLRFISSTSSMSSSSSASAPNMTPTIASTEPPNPENTNNSEKKSPLLALPSTYDSADKKLDVSGQGSTVSLDHLGPIVVNQDGTMSRISNWEKMTDIEKQNTMRIIGKRNKQRMDALKAAGVGVEGGDS
ncbi:fungal specific transcription factor, putative [Talaromyces stipitatus ATCC 10500]|uniref:Fungal specific transcription factor, putative n=1 Tax=Talaromyces stipitatus (strain ATCC 10500 / CBS 375.48 / QM 6759 / NRRL 1006) TaxID=441959 RepID=B8LUD0_TALSN|nr:fungal specific transcription factor, putative [Talaromyces stipitatus ATCC 10500]EED23703.1 fungal specific transcription factor, putative [Talaromyces stipitatus ATCC 10500]